MTSAGDLLGFAETLEGKPYVFGAEGPNAFDCSGLVQYVFHHFGVNLPRTSEQQAKVGTAVDKGAIQAGDLVFSDWGDGPNSHVGIAMGGNKIIVAPHTGTNVQVENLSTGYMNHVTAVRRIDGVTSDGSVSTPAVTVGDPLTDGIVAPLVGPLRNMADGVMSVSKVADLITKAFLPSNFIRIVCGLVGGMLILLGIRLLSKEVRP